MMFRLLENILEYKNLRKLFCILGVIFTLSLVTWLHTNECVLDSTTIYTNMILFFTTFYRSDVTDKISLLQFSCFPQNNFYKVIDKKQEFIFLFYSKNKPKPFWWINASTQRRLLRTWIQGYSAILKNQTFLVK